MIIDWGERTSTYPRAWHPAIRGVWDWGNAVYVEGEEATGLMSMTARAERGRIDAESRRASVGASGQAPGIGVG